MVAVAALMARGHAEERHSFYDRFDSRAETGASFVGAYVKDIFDHQAERASRLQASASRPERFEQETALLGFSTSVLLDGEGRVIAMSPANPALLGAELASRYTHLSSAMAGERTVSDVVPAKGTGEPVTSFALPLAGRTPGFLAVSLNLRNSPLASLLARQPIAGSRGYLLDSMGAVIVGAGEGAVADIDDRDVSAALDRAVVIDGRLLAASPIPGTSWVYLLVAPIDAVMAPFTGTGVSDWLLLAGLGALSLAGLVVAARATTARTQAREEQAAADHRMRLTVQHAPIGMTMVGLDHHFIEPNSRLCAMLGYTSEELQTLTFTDVTHPDDLRTDIGLVEQLLDSDLDHYELEKRYLRRDGTILWGRLVVSLVRDAHDQPLHFVSQIEDVTAIRSAQEDLEQRALHDPLTGLANRSLLVDRLTHALDSSRGATNVAIGGSATSTCSSRSTTTTVTTAATPS